MPLQFQKFVVNQHTNSSHPFFLFFVIKFKIVFKRVLQKCDRIVNQLHDGDRYKKKKTQHEYLLMDYYREVSNVIPILPCTLPLFINCILSLIIPRHFTTLSVISFMLTVTQHLINMHAISVANLAKIKGGSNYMSQMHWLFTKRGVLYICEKVRETIISATCIPLLQYTPNETPKK